MEPPTITITIDAGQSEPEAVALWQAVRSAVDALERLDKQLSGDSRPNNKWLLRAVSMSSPLMLTFAGVKAFDGAKDVDPVRPFGS